MTFIQFMNCVRNICQFYLFVIFLVQVNKVPTRYTGQTLLRDLHPRPVFKALPHRGVLSPGERVNVHIKFSPAEGVQNPFFSFVSTKYHRIHVLPCVPAPSLHPVALMRTIRLKYSACLPAFLQQAAEASRVPQRSSTAHHSSGSGGGATAGVLPIGTGSGTLSSSQHRDGGRGPGQKPQLFPRGVLLPGVWHRTPKRGGGASFFI